MAPPAGALGDVCCALTAGGGYAEYCTAPAVQCLPIPAGLDLVDAAGLPESFFTVWTNVFERAALAPGETLLVHGGAGGIGTTAIQIAAALRPSRLHHRGRPGALRRARAARRRARHRLHREDFAAVIKEATGGKGVDVILDIVGGDYVARDIASLARDGRLVQIAFLKGSKVEIDLMPVMLKRLTITGSTLRIQSTERKGEIAAALRQRVWPLIEEGKIRPVIFARLPLARGGGRPPDHAGSGRISAKSCCCRDIRRGIVKQAAAVDSARRLRGSRPFRAGAERARLSRALPRSGRRPG